VSTEHHRGPACLHGQGLCQSAFVQGLLGALHVAKALERKTLPICSTVTVSADSCSILLPHFTCVLLLLLLQAW
jgi:hypothetical protein